MGAKAEVQVSRSVYESVALIFYASRISGICPLVMVRTGNNFFLIRSRKALVYSFVSVGFIVCASIYGLVHNYNIKEIRKIRLRNVAGMVCTLSENVWLLLSSLLATALAPFFQRHLWKYLRCLHQVDNLLLSKRPKNQKRACCKVLLVTLSVTFFILGLDIALWASVVTRNTSILVYLVQTVPFYFTYVWKMISELHFWLLVHLMNIRLVGLKEELLQLLQEVEISQGFWSGNEYLNRKLLKVLNRGPARREELLSEKVKNIVNVHSLLVEAGTAVNDYFGLNLLVLLFGCLVHLLVTPYVLHLQITETKNSIFIGSQLMWLISHIARLVFMIEPCHACKKQMQFTVVTVCKLFHFGVSEEVRNQLRSFLVQLDRCRIQFAACNLVVIDRTLLTTVAGTVTTYLVILFQFKQ